MCCERAEGLLTAVNEADKLYLGTEVVDRVYLGDDLAWEPSGAPAFAPDDLAGLAIWFDASQLGLTDGAAVSPWPNLANAGLSGAIVGTPAPTVRAAALNGQSVVRFTVNEGRVRMTGTGVHMAWTLAYVGRMVGAGANYARVVNAIYPTGGNLLVGYHGGLQDVMYDNGWTSPHVPATVTTNWKLYSADGTPGLSRLFSDTVMLGSTGTAAGFGNTFAISGYDPTATAETSDCEVAEVCFYSRKLADAERQQVEAYLQEKWL